MAGGGSSCHTSVTFLGLIIFGCSLMQPLYSFERGNVMGYVMFVRMSLLSPSDHEQFSGHLAWQVVRSSW